MAAEQAEGEAKTLKEFKESSMANLKSMTDDIADLRVIEARAKQDDLTQAVGDRAEKIRAKAAKCMKGLEQLMLKPDALGDKAIAALNKSTIGMKKEIEDFKEKADSMGVGILAKKGKRQKKA